MRSRRFERGSLARSYFNQTSARSKTAAMGMNARLTTAGHVVALPGTLDALDYPQK